MSTMPSLPQPSAAPTKPASNNASIPQHSTPTVEQSIEQPPELTESQYMANLATLEKIQILLDTLRYTIPNLTRLLAQPPSTPEALFSEFMKKTMGPSKQLVALKKVFEEKEVKELLERARWSFGRKVVLKEGVEKYFEEVDRYGWVEREEAENRGVKRKRDDSEDGEEDKVLGDEEMEERLKAYREKYTDVTIAEWDKEAQIIKFEVQSPAAPLRFTVKRRVVKEKAVYDIKGPTCKEENRGLYILFTAIDSCLESRPHPNSLEYILDMIAAYKDLREAKCDKCKDLLDNFAMTPAARRSKLIKSEEGVEETIWVALHASCLPN